MMETPFSQIVAKVFEEEWARRGVAANGGPVTITVPPTSTSAAVDAGVEADQCEAALPAGATLELGGVLETPPMSREGSSSNLAGLTLGYSTPS
mmetsp:Transcript_28243/g.49032  ORF Transcript_28243/g.49032 Transcript_28243/m.49032 type:complete len:94 (+) Transcript_28243:63-344(+)